MRRVDLAIIGGGTAGLIAAFGAAGVGARVLLAERDRTGGDCLWTGCVPSKALIAAAELAHGMRHADELGLSPVEPEVDLAEVLRHVHDAQHVIAEHDSPERLRRAGVEFRHAEGRFVEPGRIDVGEERIGYRAALIATGSRPTLPPIDGLETVDVFTSDSVWGLDALPDRLVVVGGGAVGCELAQAFARLGSRVTLIELRPQLLHREEPDAARVVKARLEAEGITVHLGATATGVQTRGSSRTLVFEGPEGPGSVPFDRLLVAVGRTPVTDALGLERVGVETDGSGHVVVDEHLATTGTRVYAAGDVIDSPRFTHVAAHEGGLVVMNSLFHLRRRPDYERTPWVTFTDPEVGRIGLTESEARDRHGDDVIVTRYDHDQLDRAIVAGRTPGFTKLVADGRGRIVGATVVSPRGGEATAEVAAWMHNGGQLDDLSQAVHAYPTYTLGLQHAANEYMREKWFSPRVRAIAKPLLTVLRWLQR
ncbi:MAG: FAD-dependent oxidoreductase [Nitriliruptorales bacterium]|nr:FAD-dependent oxidoreductase [Nitriliruptorales bacterium]